MRVFAVPLLLDGRNDDGSNRGCSYHFSFRAVLEFLHSNDLFSVIRGHEVMYPGFQMYKADPKNQFPSLITLFSAPNYW